MVYLGWIVSHSISPLITIQFWEGSLHHNLFFTVRSLSSLTSAMGLSTSSLHSAPASDSLSSYKERWWSDNYLLSSIYSFTLIVILNGNSTDLGCAPKTLSSLQKIEYRQHRISTSGFIRLQVHNVIGTKKMAVIYWLFWEVYTQYRHQGDL